MASAAIWLDELGIPPREVCLDWAWQIQSQFAEHRRSIRGDAAALDWRRIEVSPTGELLLPPNLQDYSPDSRLRDLLRWAKGNVAATPNEAEPAENGVFLDLHEQLCKLTANRISPVAEHLLPVPDSPRDSSHSTDGFGPESFKPVVTQIAGKRASKKSNKNAHLFQQVVVAIKEHKLAAALVAVSLAAVCCFVLFFREQKLKTVEVSSAKPVAEEGKLTSEERAKDSSSDVDDANVLATIPEMPLIDPSEPVVGEVAPVTMPSISSSLITGSDRSKLGNSTEASTAESLEVAAVIPSDQASPVVTNPLESSDASELKNRDVMQELDELTKSAANRTLESDMAMPEAMDSSSSAESSKADPTNGGAAIAEPLMLGTSPMLQTHKLASKIKVRPRQPVWQMRLSVDDEFELTPKEPQDVSDRQLTTWLLSDSDATSPIVRLVIQAQAAPGRQAALRWRVFASAEDLPELMLPLDKEILNPLQDRLRVYAQMAQREADRLKQLASSAERDLRAAMNKQRTHLESQSKLASRISTVVAEARLLDDLLRSQLTVHAKLVDGSDSGAPAFLQFGDPNKLPTNEN